MNFSVIECTFKEHNIMFKFLRSWLVWYVSIYNGTSRETKRDKHNIVFLWYAWYIIHYFWYRIYDFYVLLSQLKFSCYYAYAMYFDWSLMLYCRYSWFIGISIWYLIKFEPCGEWILYCCVLFVHFAMTSNKGDQFFLTVSVDLNITF